MHLAILAGERTIGIEHHRSVVIDSCGASLEERRDNDDFFPPSDLTQTSVLGPGIASASLKLR